MIKPTCRQTAASYSYYIKDHLGSVRIVANSSCSVQQKNTYYAFGGLVSDQCTNFDVQPYRFQGKELDRTHGMEWNDHGARFADLLIARWMTMDPLCEKFYSMSPYLLCGGNMVNKVDPDGMDYWSTNDPNQIIQFLNAIGAGNGQNDMNDAIRFLKMDYEKKTVGSFSVTNGGYWKVFKTGQGKVKVYSGNVNPGRKGFKF